MVWAVSLLTTDLITRSLTAAHVLVTFGVYLDLIGGEALASYQSLYLMPV